jgi:hypothetical protein
MSKRLVCWAIVLAIGLSAPAWAELVGYWKLDEGKGEKFLDQTDYWNDGTITPWNEAAVRWSTSGYDANCIEILLADNLTTLCDAKMLNPNQLNVREATFAFWMNMPTNFQAWGTIFVLHGTGDDHSIEPDGAADLYIGRNPWFGTKNAKLGDGQWHHIAVTFSTTGRAIIIYVDGQAAATNSTTLSDPIDTVRIGGPHYTGRGQWRRFIGKLDEAAVWDTALSAADIKNVLWFGPYWTRYATSPEPANGAAVGTVDITLRWAAGDSAAQHHVYIGESLQDVKDGTGGTDMGLVTTTSFSNYSWQLGKTYYWRVDEVNADGAVAHPGVVWSFTIPAKLATNPAPANGAVMVDPNGLVLSWTAGSGAVSHDVFLGTDSASLPRVSSAQTATTYDPPLLQYGTTYYWRVDEHEGTNTYTGDVWGFKTVPDIKVTDPTLLGFWNFDQDQGDRAVDWSGNGMHGQIIGGPAYVQGYIGNALEFDGVDDRVEVPRTVTTNLTLMAWIKTSTPGAEGTTAREGSGLLWSDHAGGGDHFTVAVLGKKLVFETGPGPEGTPTAYPNTYSNKDVVTGEWVHVAVTRAESTKAVQILVDGGVDATGTHTGDTNVGSNPLVEIGANTLDARYFAGIIDEVRAYNTVLTQDQIALAMRGRMQQAWRPNPAMAEFIDIRRTEPLSWSAGDGAAEHDVYFGTDEPAVQAATRDTAGIYKGRQTQTTYSLTEPLVYKQSYYWRVDEVAADKTVVAGRVWSFTVADYLIVDTFESYTNDSPNRVFQTWIDGIGFSADEFFPNDVPPNGTGSAVGHDIWTAGGAHYEQQVMETIIVHGGSQSMPLYYDNSNASTGYHSEASRTWSTPQNWTLADVDTLQLYIRGVPVDFMEAASGTILLSGAGADIWGTADEFRFAYKTFTGDGWIEARVDRLVDRHPYTKGGVMIRQSLDPASAFGGVYATGGNGFRYQARLRNLVDAVADDAVATAEQTNMNEPNWVKIERVGDQVNGYYSTDGTHWTPMAWNPQAIVLTGDVLIGLAVTSHVAGNPAVAEFSDVKTSSNVTGPWQVAVVGAGAQPANSRADLYVVVQDDKNNTATAEYPDGAVVENFTPWNIPLASLTGVDASAITRMTIGVGKPTNSPADGTGLVYIDDICVIKRPAQ